MSEDNNKKLSRITSDQLLTVMTTEHYTLQMGRANTISDANGRSSLFLNSLSGVLVALAFVGQVSKLDQTFFLFAIVLLPPVFFLGLTCFVRVLETAIEDMVYVRGINRIRHYYQEVAPDMEGYFILSTHDDGPGMLRNMGFVPNNYQTLLTNAGAIYIINSVIIGVITGLILDYVLHLDIWWCVGVGVGVFLFSAVLHQIYQTRSWRKAEKHYKVRFPTPPDEGQP